jgi:hypothetical protein
VTRHVGVPGAICMRMRKPISHRGIPALATVLSVAAALVVGACSGATNGARSHPLVSPAELDSARVAFRRATELLHELPLPGRSRSLRHEPAFARGLSDPPQRPAVRTLVDRHALWAVPLPPTRALAWVAAHAPPGWRVSQRGGTSTYGRPETWYIGFSPPGTSLGDTEVLVTAAPSARGDSSVRVDAQTIWHPPRSKSSLVPLSVRQLTVAVRPEAPVRGSTGPPSPPVAIVDDPAKLRAVALAVNRLRVSVVTLESCVAIPYPATYVWLEFRERSEGPVVAEVRASPYECSGGGSAVVRVHGHRSPTLGGSVQFVGEIERLLGVKLKGL